MSKPSNFNECNLGEYDIWCKDTNLECYSSVSVIIPIAHEDPIHNVRSLSEAIDSVLAQSTAVTEVVVVDVSISGDSERIVEDYPRVRYIRRAPSSVSAACNTGIQESSGDYLLFLNPEDRLAVNAVAVGINCLEVSSDCGFAIGIGKPIASRGLPLQSVTDLQEQVLGVPIYRSLLGGTHLLPSARVIFRREVFEQIGGFDESLDCAAEYDLYLRAAAGFAGCRHNQVVVEYRGTREVQTPSASPYSQILRDYLNVLQRQRPHLKHSCSDRKACEGGKRYWYGIYKSELVREIMSCYRQWQFATATKALRLMLRCYSQRLS